MPALSGVDHTEFLHEQMAQCESWPAAPDVRMCRPGWTRTTPTARVTDQLHPEQRSYRESGGALYYSCGSFERVDSGVAAARRRGGGAVGLR